MSYKRNKIFVVDDISFSLIKTKQILKDYYTVYPLESSADMFELLEKVKPDLILLDINMPKLDGYETIKLLKTNEKYAGIPVIFLSGLSDEDKIVKGLNLGAVDHISKPFDPKTLLTCIGTHLHPVQTKELFQIDTDKSISKQQSILAVDDCPSTLRAIQFALRNKYKIHTLQKPENLEKILKGMKPDLFLLDYNMPVINGFELVNVIREAPGCRHTPIIFLSSENSPKLLNEAIQLGISGYILKPFNPEKLRDKIAVSFEKYEKENKERKNETEIKEVLNKFNKTEN
jgi:PleD family two-component response regulator